MKFLRLVCAGLVREQIPQHDAEKHFEECGAFGKARRKTSHLVECTRLSLHTATTLRVRRSKVSTTDGPYAETKG